MLTDIQLEQMVEHVQYEVDELRKAAQKVCGSERGKAEWNPAIESYLLHFRNLRAFFLKQRRDNGDDVSAKDYIPDWNPVVDAILEDTKAEIDKRLAHLTAARLIKNNWPLTKMNDAIEELISKFKKSLRAPKAEWFSQLTERSVILAFVALDNSTCSTRIIGQVIG